jgi:Hypervirulence associated proteins TUDOR domain
MTEHSEEPGKGDKVVWRSHGRDVPGRVTGRITERTEAAGRTVAASPDEPQFTVRSDKTGRKAVHRPEALRKRS